MSTTADNLSASHQHIADQTITTVRRWLAESEEFPADASATRLAGVLKDPNGLEFTLGFIDTVVRPEDVRVAGRNLERLTHIIPAFLPWYLRFAIMVGGGFAPLLPWIIVPIARRVLRQMVGHLIIDATPAKLDKALTHLRAHGSNLNLNLLGEAVLGDDEADARLAGTKALLRRDDVNYVSIKVSSVVSQLSMWAFDETVDRVVDRLTPLYLLALNSPEKKFINLDMEEFKDLDLTIAVFEKLLDQPELLELEAGIVLQAYLPDALSALQELTRWSMERRARGGAGIKVRVVKGANLAMEHVDSITHHWPLATWNTKQDSDTHYKRVLDWAFTPERMDAVRIGVAGHNLFDIAFAWHLAQERGVTERVEFEMLLGMATGQAEAIKKDVGSLLLYTPVVQPSEFDSAISYLVRRLEENASTENFMSGLFELSSNEAIFIREQDRFLASLANLDVPAQTTNRVQDRSQPAALIGDRPFNNVADTDPAIGDNRTWGRAILARSLDSQLGIDSITAGAVTTHEQMWKIIASTSAAGRNWGAMPAAERAAILHRAGDSMENSRARLIEIMAHEAGKTIAEGDVEVSEAIDFAHYYAERALDLETIEDAKFVPSALTVVTPPWNFPVAIPAGSVLSALAAGSGVIIKPAKLSQRSAAVMIEALWEAGVPREVLQLVDLKNRDLGKTLIADPAVDRVILTGAWETAAMFREWRSDLPILAETSGKNAIIVTPSADLDLAVADITKSAFGHAGQKCSAASLVILVGSVATSERFERQLVDSVRTLRVGLPHNPLTTMGPIVEPAQGKLLGALTTLAPGESWLVKPRQLDDEGKQWTPGVRTGVVAGSEFHLTEYFGPVLGVMRAKTLAEAIEMQNAVDYGLTAGIHSLDSDEVALWLDEVQAGNAYVNRGITGAIVRRQPFGGWKRSAVGRSAKAGGPNYLMTLGEWEAVEQPASGNIQVRGLSDHVSSVIKKAQAGMEFDEFDRVRRAAESDQRAWETEFGVSRDVSGLGVERNVFRYRSVPVTIRLSEGQPLGHLVRLIAGAARVGSTIHISSAVPLPSLLTESFETGNAVSVADVVVESDARWLERAARGEITTTRVRLIGGSALALSDAVKGNPDIAIWGGPVTTSGRVELLIFVHEQSLSITAHRFGNPDPAMAALEV
ncbi:bifunctional proline dehydrogenase/L-glutamate gamma-semialdehyde dehydrogenase [Salinibacterium sp. SWN1162]|uniref:bifunctional proline dehydrogenase/L-glutamate gamma-semialdehyde dehydrogenase n=1 Tax=Salinibacterium sp. SWN1162 TaxID=2792053 RepID=UPI0018CFDB2F|nr:bifunctional proline dehydrogenase/L-glutamate gamma-semialdehyde dehydrogenase [Salinibacterium sp. SWN1162]MBH0007896.1 bifunctional proline dehydrogenase/L-glutamate gamma-semialdehyde dehydrogenase [Salinibacterium sp. SWN1162]